MSLLSLLIALMAEKTLSSSIWRFDFYYQKYISFFQTNGVLSNIKATNIRYTLFLLVPVAIIYGILAIVDNGLLHLIISTLVLIVTLGCSKTRNSYKQYLLAAFKGDDTTSSLHHQQLLEDKNLPAVGFGQALIWLNYRYYIAIMLFFIVFGAAGAVFYRLLTTVIEQENGCTLNKTSENETAEVKDSEQTLVEETIGSPLESSHDESINDKTTLSCNNYHKILFYIDWLPVRITSFGYMFVGHFSKAFPMWLESLFDTKKLTHEVLIDVAQKSEDIMLEDGDCTAEPCLLVRLAKRNLLLMLALIAVLTLIGIVN
ncbi:beta-lactamase regulator AmpE [Colwellia sp. 6_MG-2023]|uniref:beta-lactamase regulator AmpE n=1 Tax=Colwellia sp. 6_MG-2023 TaxID=3062676 RepID=UPI0026E39E3C|nr:beta-lactamase regulator AmpE [Colwellia sp. 6_MG-2023]MDO6489490.1 beta-lactamase regulator AmpE [Colwellia sp. 6_MG-2023]